MKRLVQAFFFLSCLLFPSFLQARPGGFLITLDWLGHSCFLVKATRFLPPRPIPLRRHSGFGFIRETFTILIDPYGAATGYPVRPVKADAVFVSHEHFDHNNVGMAPGAKIYRGLKDDAQGWNILTKVELSPGIRLSTVGVYHDHHKGALRGLNSVSIFDIYGLRVVHLGDLGHLLSPEKVKEIRPVDILLIPVGGHFTIGGKEAREVVSQLKPRVVIPMHYRTRYTNLSNLPIHGPESFVTGSPWPVKRPDTSTLVFNKGDLPRKTTIYLLQPQSSAPPVRL